MAEPSMAEEELVVKKVAGPQLQDGPEFREAVARAQTAEDDLEVIHNGTQMWKVRSFSKWYHRKYFVDSSDGMLKYEPTHKNQCFNEPRFIEVSEILDVRRGWKTDTFNKFGNKVVGEQRRLKSKVMKRLGSDGEAEEPGKPLVDEACCFSVVYGDSRGSLDLVASSPQMAAVWVRALRHVVTVMRGLNQEKRFNMWLKNQFVAADQDNSGSLAFDECLRLLLRLNVKMSKKEALCIFNLADTNKSQGPNEEPSLDAKEFVQFYQLLMRRPEVEDIYHRYARSAREMTAHELQHFLKKEQNMSEATLDECRCLIDAFEQSELKASGRISVHGFTHMLRSEQFQVRKVAHKTVYQDMTQPLSSYYIASSHNTYLLGRQVVADSTIEGYVEALRRGCRCLELDCWDGPDGEPVVTHGYALTSKLIFREVLKDAILPNAFVCSEYPVILSLENHCTPEQQKRLAFHISDVFGDLLYLEDVPEDLEALPSPEELKHRILIKGRKAAPVQTPESESDDDDEMDSLSPPNGRSNGKKSSESSSESEPSRPPSPAAQDAGPAAHKPAVRKVSAARRKPSTAAQLEKVTDQKLSDLVNVCQGTHFHGFKEPGKCYEMVSLSESKAAKLIEKSAEAFVEFNTRRLSKVYPAGTRTGSTNFQPWPYWNAGCQIAALNYQGHGKPVFINEAKFGDNGGCGFVLKPDYLRLPDCAKFSYTPTANCINQLHALKDRRRLLEIRVISGQHLPKPEGEGLTDILDPYVKVKIIGHPMDKRKRQTHVINDNGFNPRWDCTFQFVINLPELAFVYFIVKDETPRRHDPVVGAYALPVLSMAPGYSHVPLVDMKRRALEPATLFIHTKVTEVSY
ncbi:1-phosphatidylinositol 4,5-bisphosphate phosphodiesterase zeta-1 [Frankliniella occidentalis]|uniref:Phosphoinositide phospholipase C n=1 Tax=Frankliniella occidentalis TaxID=133901 RepID=A0A9C6U7D1_FRAOC|nr:1-phosphatidylinositol 4,5-bisphosphate phosphodiesterase zeta-1 [Frankliniella occidentalis]